MVCFAALALSALTAHAVSAENPVKSVVDITSPRSLAEPIGGYTPKSKVTDHNALDLDQKYMEIELAKETSTGYLNAQAIYEKGGNSMSYARVKLTSPLAFGLSKGSPVEGRSIFGGKVTGTIYRNVDKGQTVVKILYDTSEDQNTWVMCRVGALKQFQGLETSGCLVNTGTLKIQNESYEYEYDPLLNNANGRTLKGLSDDVQPKMIDCLPGCPFEDARMFSTYYGAGDYGDEWINAAFNGRLTNFNNGNADFKIWKDNDDATREVIKKGSVCMNVFMSVIRKFEESIAECRTEFASSEIVSVVETWDEGVAFYTGSIEGTDGTGSGKFLHELADKRCTNFKTCGTNGGLIGGTAYINHKLRKLFVTGQNQILTGQCGAARSTLRSITKHMYIPLIQGSLRYAYVVGNEYGGDKEKAEGAVFTAAVLPRIHAVNPMAAKVIYNNMKVGAESTDFADVKAAYESVYSGLGINCAKVGGIVNTVGDYKDGARVCTDNTDSNDDDDKKTADDDDKKTADDDDKQNAIGDGSGGSKKSLIFITFAAISAILLSV